jgi:putative transposase
MTTSSPKPAKTSKKADDTRTTRVLRLRLKDKHAPRFQAQAREVNLVWNFCNEHSARVLERENRFISAFDLHPYTRGAGKAGLSLHSQTLQGVAEEFVTRRKQFKKAKLRWRVSTGPRRSLGWIPFKASAIQYRNGQVIFNGQALSLWDSYGLSGYELGAGSVSEDARGRWYINFTVKTRTWPHSQDLSRVSAQALGIDLGLKDLMVDSQGGKVQAQQFYRGLEPKLAVAQRAGHKSRVKAIHAKIVNRRADHLHKLSTALVRTHQAIFVGDVNAQALAQTKLAKSVLDVGWSTFRTMLQYKCADAGTWFTVVNERYSTQECSACHARTGPKGREGLSVRNWTCSVCHAEHDRDTNAALIIEQRGLAWLAKEFSTASQEAQGEPSGVVNKRSSAPGANVFEAGHGLPAVGILAL